MSEKIYARLLRLFPMHFRNAYGDEALQLFRDRARDEKGLFRSVRLWFDLLADLAISVPRQYRYGRPAFAGAAIHRLEAPAFFILVDRSPGPGPLVLGSALSLAGLGLFSVLLGRPGIHVAPRAAAYQQGRAPEPRPFASGHATGKSSDRAEEVVRIAGRAMPDEGEPNNSESSESPQESSRFLEAAPAQMQGVAKRKRLMNAVIENLRQHYIDSEIAGKTGDALLAHERNGDDDKVADDRAFADLLTKQIRDASHDMHLEVVYSQQPLPDLLPKRIPEAIARYRKAMEQENCAFEKAQMLPHNIGYVKLNAFPDPSVCRLTATTTMATLNHAEAMIFDLRDNRGGYSSMVSLIAAYLFDHPEYMYDPRVPPTRQSWTLSPVAGNMLADKPVYVLTSSATISAAEQFCYDLKMLKRVTLVGERTGGSAHAGVFHRIDDHFGMGIPEAKAINPYSESDWEAIGVEPHVKVTAADALATAERLAENRLRKHQ